MEKVVIDYETDAQFMAIALLAKCFENGGINFDNFFLGVYKNFGSGNSVCLRVIFGNKPEAPHV